MEENKKIEGVDENLICEKCEFFSMYKSPADKIPYDCGYCFEEKDPVIRPAKAPYCGKRMNREIANGYVIRPAKAPYCGKRMNREIANGYVKLIDGLLTKFISGMSTEKPKDSKVESAIESAFNIVEMIDPDMTAREKRAMLLKAFSKLR